MLLQTASTQCLILRLGTVASECVAYVLLKLIIFNITLSDVQQSVKGDDGLMYDVLSTSENVITHVIFQLRLKIRHRVCRSSGGPCVKE